MSKLEHQTGVLGLRAFLPISAQCCISYNNQTVDLVCKSNVWFLYGMHNRLSAFRTESFPMATSTEIQMRLMRICNQ